MDTQNFHAPMIGETAPSFIAESTRGQIRFPDDFGGKWVLLFSHPGDFTPVCTSEILLFGAMQEEFEALNCHLLGLSVGSVASHIAWLRSIEQNIQFKGHSRVRVRFPMLADASMEIARKYGMIAPRINSTMAVRSVFFIDPEAKIRATITYPMQLGRNFSELKRVLVGLQTVDRHKVALPADWLPGDDIIVGAPSTYDGTQQAMDGLTCYDWYFCTKALPLKEKERVPITSL